MRKTDRKINKKTIAKTSRRKVRWFDINWEKATTLVKQRQVEIAVAYKAGDLTKVNDLQHRLVNSFARKRVAVNTVTTNKGKKTAGIDGVIWDGPEQKIRAT
jgi:RNA-directed DNA polymerase